VAVVTGVSSVHSLPLELTTFRIGNELLGFDGGAVISDVAMGGR